MKAKVTILLLLGIISFLFWFADFEYSHTYFNKAYHTFLALTISYLVLRFVLEGFVAKRINEAKARYSFRKVISILYILTFVIIALTVWIENTQTLLVSYGVIAAGTAFALQDIIKNFAGGITIFVTGIYRVGDRIEIDSKRGDVIDVGILYTTLMETNEWIQADQATGRLSTISNGYVLSGTINNYTRDHNYIWKELTIPITYDSDWKEAISLIVDIVEKQTKDVAQEAEKSISRLDEKYYLPKGTVGPSVFLTMTDNWINLNVRYISEVRQARLLHNKLSQILLDEIQKSDRIKIASATLAVAVTDWPETKEPK